MRIIRKFVNFILFVLLVIVLAYLIQVISSPTPSGPSRTPSLCEVDTEPTPC